jgi:hypothetical protein
MKGFVGWILFALLGCGGSSDVATTAFDGDASGSGGSTGSDAALLCVPGQSIACVGPGACQGGQACNADGRSYAPCACGAGGDAGVTLPDGNPCAPLTTIATDVYVDQRFTGVAPTGVAACPFTTIAAGIAAAAGLAGTRTVHVAGAAPALVYAEAAPVAVAANLVIQGDGPAKTTISASGVCGAGTCAVGVAGGGTLDGFTVVSSGGDGIRTEAAAPAPIVKNVSASGSKGNGIVALGGATLGPNIVASNNGGQGVASTGATGAVHVVAGANAFDNNGANGIDVEGAALTFEGGSATGNGFNGIRFGGVGGLGNTHTVTALVAKNNNTGISSFGSQNLTVRSSTLVTNKFEGLLFNYAAGYTLDLGKTGDAGGNVFGGATIATRNAKAGIYLCKSLGAGTQAAEGNSFAACPPTQTSLAGCDVAPAAYADVAYAPAVAGDPVVATACSVGP